MIYIVQTQCTSSDKLIRPADFNAGHLSLSLYRSTQTCATLEDYDYCENEEDQETDFLTFYVFREAKSEL